VEVDGSVDACERGLHACRLEDLAYWIAPELWEVELDDVVVETSYKVVARRGRLVRRVPQWPESEPAFAQACAERARALAVEHLHAAGCAELAEQAAVAATSEQWLPIAEGAEASASPLVATLTGMAMDCYWDIERSYFTMCAYVAATAFGCASTGGSDQDMSSVGWHEERARQARWLAERLDLTA
jgi:hypothetical protein